MTNLFESDDSNCAKPIKKNTALSIKMPLLLLAAALAAYVGPAYGSPNIVVLAAIFAASLTSSIAGFAFSAICGGILFHLSGDTVQVVQVMMICSIANQIAMTWSLRREIDWRTLMHFLGGGVFGLPIGICILLTVDRDLYLHSVGGFLLIYGAYTLFSRPLILPQRPGFDFLAGFVGGITGGAIGFPGAPVTIWCSYKGWEKARQRSVFQPFILFMQLIALCSISLLRYGAEHRQEVDLGDFFCVPVALLGTAIGLTMYRRLSNRQFALAVNILMIVSGVSYLV